MALPCTAYAGFPAGEILTLSPRNSIVNLQASGAVSAVRSVASVVVDTALASTAVHSLSLTDLRIQVPAESGSTWKISASVTDADFAASSTRCLIETYLPLLAFSVICGHESSMTNVSSFVTPLFVALQIPLAPSAVTYLPLTTDLNVICLPRNAMMNLQLSPASATRAPVLVRNCPLAAWSPYVPPVK